MITCFEIIATDGETNRQNLKSNGSKYKTGSKTPASKQRGALLSAAQVGTLVDALVGALVGARGYAPVLMITVLLITVITPQARALDNLNFTTDIYMQTMYRPEERLDRPHGVFHETRLRSTVNFEALSDLKFDVGSYLLAEWSEASQASSSITNTAVSPFFGSHWRNSWSLQSSLGSSTVSFTVQFEGRYREPVSDFSRSTGVKGWDPRTGAAVGVWHQFNPEFYLDFYADLFYAPKYSASPMSTAIARLGNRSTLSQTSEATWRPFADLYFELFQQNAMNIELGTKRSEARTGVAIGATQESGSIQLRIYNGWPLASDRDSRSRLEALLVGGFSL